MNLERNLIDNILECDIKLGKEDNPICFYYPLSSLVLLLGCSEDDVESGITEFNQFEKDRLCDVKIEELPNEKGRYGVTISSKGVRWVHDNYSPSNFMREFVLEIKRQGNKLEDMVRLFYRYSQNVKVEKVSVDEWSVSFEDESVDPYVYHIEQNPFGLEYHRFIKEEYNKLFY